MNGADLLRIVDLMHREKSISKDIIFEGIEAAVQLATEKHYGEGVDIAVTIDRDSGVIQAKMGDEVIDPGLLGRPGQVQRPVQVHRVRGGRVEIAQRVVGQCGQAQDRVVASQVAGLHIPHVLRALQHVFRGGTEIASLVQAEVEPLNLVPGSSQERHQDRTDVATVARDENSHPSPTGSAHEFDGAPELRFTTTGSAISVP